jgi:CRISPR system Cascade subunit CasB
MTQATVAARSTPRDKADRFVARISQVINDPGTRAALRSGLARSPERAVRMHAVVAPWIPERTPASIEWAYYTVAALIAAGPRPRAEPTSAPASNQENESGTAPNPPATSSPDRRYSGNLGAALARAVEAEVLNEDRAEDYLHLLVRQGPDGLHRHLPRIVRRLHDAGVPIDWGQLLDDLARWGRWRDDVAKRWLQTYHRRRTPSPDHPDRLASITESEDR